LALIPSARTLPLMRHRGGVLATISVILTLAADNLGAYITCGISPA
jgi:hypothetical protein